MSTRDDIRELDAALGEGQYLYSHGLEILHLLGFDTLLSRRGTRWRSEPGELWTSPPDLMRSFDDAMRVARLIDPQVTFSAVQSQPRGMVAVAILIGGDYFAGQHASLAIAACRALLAYRKAYLAQQDPRSDSGEALAYAVAGSEALQ